MKVKLIFSGYLFGIFALQAGLFLITISEDPGKVRVFYSAAQAGFCVFTGLFYPLVKKITGCRPRKTDILLPLWVTAAAAAVSLTGVSFKGFYTGSSGFLVPYFRYSSIALFTPLLAFWVRGMVLLFRQYAVTDSLYLKNRLKYPLIGSVILFAGVFINLTPLKEFPLDIVFYLTHALFFGYTVVSHRVAAVKTALVKGTLIFIAVAFLLAAHYFITRAAEFFFSEYISSAVLSVFSLFIIVLLFALMYRKRFFIAAAGLFSRNALDRQQLLTEYGRTILPAVHPETIYRKLEHALQRIGKVEVFYAYSENNREMVFEPAYSCTAEGTEVQLPSLDKEHPFFELASKEGGPLWIEEFKTERVREKVQDFISLFPSGLEPEIVVPLCEGKAVIGFFCFREKYKRKIYIQEDFVLLSVLGVLTSAALLQTRVIEDLEKSLQEKDLLLKEVHHRVKNNLQLISSLLELQKTECANEAIDKLFTEAQNRINSIAHVHESIYISENFSKINSREYIESLTADIRSQYDQDGRVELHLQMEDIFLNISQAIPMGLIINELITNAFKHAFSESRKGTLSIQTHRNNGQVVCRIKDNGLGLPSVKKPASLGLTIVEALATGQLEGSWEIHVNGGTEHVIAFPFSEPVTG